MSLEKAKEKLSELLLILGECLDRRLASELLQPAIRLVDSELAKQTNRQKYQGDDQVRDSDAEDRKTAIKRMQEEAGEKLMANIEKSVRIEETEPLSVAAAAAEQVAQEAAERETEEAEEKAAKQAKKAAAKAAKEEPTTKEEV